MVADEPKSNNKDLEKAQDQDNVPMVQRSNIEIKNNYLAYNQDLRRDFVYSCAYCTMAESEAHGIKMTIDHYEARSSRPDLENTYENLMYCCEKCNTLKSNISPPDGAVERGLRVFKIDRDIFEQHFTMLGLNLQALTNVGEFTIEYLILNRPALQTIRENRMRLTACRQHASAGIRSLLSFHIDRLPPAKRASAISARNRLAAAQKQIAADIDAMLRDLVASPLLDEDPLWEEQLEKRRRYLDRTKAMFPGTDWRPKPAGKVQTPVRKSRRRKTK